MGSDRTPEQVAADDALTEAVLNAIEVHGLASPREVATNFVVLVSIVGVDDEGDDYTGHIKIFRDGRMPVTEQIGLLRIATLNVERQLFGGEE